MSLIVFSVDTTKAAPVLGLLLPKETANIAKESLYKTLLKFNKTLLECLRLAISNNDQPDLAHLLRISETTGQDTTSILRDLYQRVSQAKEIPRSPSSSGNSEKNFFIETSGRDTRNDFPNAAELPADSPKQLPSLAGQGMHNKFWKGRDHSGFRMESKPSPGPLPGMSRTSSTRSSCVSYTSQDVLEANLDRLIQHSRENAPSTFASSSALRHSSASLATSASILQRNKESLARWKSI
ncbi:hypothetical protein LTR99_001128 [Exophiala xenobiotica]|uniref:Uncharacterized protein n=1 Tax=Vermiconidia calcicola TaxID=1690605 RepID=A0AAV9QNH3_9PEZI|nr:hypothetical protein LTR92_001560 [Exophiala xenobiotica]KAK5545690.1 hypothetical protein LTR25_000698 [Vermiconidia calcicola]KAK5550050.1 hypothetical protein LTR23_000343 [Chaetothyriales sp. CCFEE 6169]KAK5271715.1 hypothetical protein LTR96_003542 [Exophiala xenobiotica]KAK5308155.1 hypothetical protein LTR99_001128 [Exophiala xenobiotica]